MKCAGSENKARDSTRQEARGTRTRAKARMGDGDAEESDARRGRVAGARSCRFLGRSFFLSRPPPPPVSGSPFRPLISDQRDRNRHLDSLSVIRLCGYRSVVPPRLETSIGIDENANQIIAPLNNRLLLQSQKP